MVIKRNVVVLSGLIGLLIISVFTAVFAQGNDYIWDIQSVDVDGGSGTSIALDSNGYPHIATSGGGIRYERMDASGWLAPEVVEAGEFGDPALVLDENNYPHISYQAWNFSLTGLKYAYKDAAGWHSEYVYSKTNNPWQLGINSSITLDTDGYPHISFLYQTSTAVNLMYAYKDLTGWHVVNIFNLGASGIGTTSIALDINGNPHIVAYRGTGNTDMIYLSYTTEQGWVYSPVADCGQSSQMRLDNAGYPHIAYQGCDQDLKYLYKDDQNWHVQTIDDLGTTGYYPSLFLANDVPYIAYARNYYKNSTLMAQDLRVAFPIGSGWNSYLVDDGNSVVGKHGGSPSIAVDPSDGIHISYAYLDGSNRDLMYAYGETEPIPCNPELAIAKFNDINLNGVKEENEPLITWNFTMTINGAAQTIQSPDDGWYTTTLTETNSWSVSEHAVFNWTPTTPSSQNGIAACSNIEVLIGNAYTGFDIFLPITLNE